MDVEYLVNSKGEKLKAVLPIKEYEALLEKAYKFDKENSNYDFGDLVGDFQLQEGDLNESKPLGDE